jgi:hypothetical protein
MNEIFAELHAIMMTLFTCLKVNTNVASCSKEEINLSRVLMQYSLFPKNIVSMLDEARKVAKLRGWGSVEAELNRNIGEELGSDSSGVPHYLLLASAMRQEFDLEIWTAVPETATDRFIDSMRSALRDANPFYVMGVTYALECTAVPELQVVIHLVQYLASQRDNATLHPETVSFFDRHLGVWEPGHEAELKKAIDPYLTNEMVKTESFKSGFLQVMHIMERWWHELTREASDTP